MHFEEYGIAVVEAERFRPVAIGRGTDRLGLGTDAGLSRYFRLMNGANVS